MGGWLSMASLPSCEHPDTFLYAGLPTCKICLVTVWGESEIHPEDVWREEHEDYWDRAYTTYDYDRVRGDT